MTEPCLGRQPWLRLALWTAALTDLLVPFPVIKQHICPSNGAQKWTLNQQWRGMALLEVSACRKAHYSTEFFHLWSREQFGQLLGAAGRGAGTSIAPLQQCWFSKLGCIIHYISNYSRTAMPTPWAREELQAQKGQSSLECSTLNRNSIINWSRYTHYY